MSEPEFIPTSRMTPANHEVIERNLLFGSLELDHLIAGRVEHKRSGCDAWYCHTADHHDEMHRYTRDELFVILMIAVDRAASRQIFDDRTSAERERTS